MRIDNVEYTTFTGWIGPPGDVQPALSGDLACDVAVVGGGVGGMSTALRLAERGLDVVLLEAEFCGHGSSSRNAGQLASGPGGDVQLLKLLFPRRFPRIVRYAESSALFLEHLIEHYDIDCDYEPTGNVGVAVSRGQLGRVRRVAKVLREAGAKIELGTSAELGIPRVFLGGVREPVGGTLNPGRFTLALRNALLASEARVYEQTPVQSAEQSGNGVLLTTPGGQVRAKRVVLANNAFSGDLAITPKRLCSPIWVSQAETAPIDPARLDALGWTSRSGLVTQHNIMENYRLTAHNTIVFGVRRLERGTRPLARERLASETVVADLAAGFERRFPALADVDVARAWGGWIAITPSWLPVAGTVGDNVYYSIACNGHGLGQASYVGSMIADVIAGDEPHEDLRAIWKTKPWFGPAPWMSALGLRAIWAVDRFNDRINGSRRNARRGADPEVAA